MREILFRGKRLVDGKWIAGYFVDTGRYNAIKPKGEVYYGVDPSTVGQYTGLTDKDGKKIFEGDIIGDGERKYAVSFEKGCWVILGKIEFWDFLQTNAKSYEVIGNIHDNPELLEVLTDE